jgi:hypothetical protein
MRIHKLIQCALVTLFLQFGHSQGSVAANPVVEFDMGNIRVDRKAGEYVSFTMKDGVVVTVADRTGSYWPPVHIDDHGMIYVGDKILDSRNGRMLRNDNNPDLVLLGPNLGVSSGARSTELTLRSKGGACEVKLDALQKGLAGEDAQSVLRGRVRLVNSANALTVLSSVFADDGSKLDYRISIAEPQTCHVMSSVDLANPDLLVELGWSHEGGYWIVGSQEPTLLRSPDGKVWTSVKLPEEFSELMSADIPGKDDIWLAALDGRDPAVVDSPSLIHSADGGKTWESLTWSNPLLNQVPRYWLEGQLRAHGRVVK